MIVVELKNALYSLKQASRVWHNDINTLLLSLKFTQLVLGTDPGIPPAGQVWTAKTGQFGSRPV